VPDRDDSRPVRGDLPGTRGRPTMRDVAARAGVGIKTVSRVFNGVPTVSAELADRVRAAAADLGYRPNLTAASLRRTGGRTDTIGLLLEDIANPYSSTVHRAVEDYARSRGAFVLAGSLDEDPRREAELVRALIDRRVDGLIVMPAGRDHRYVVAEQRAGTAFVFIDREPGAPIADVVVSDNRAAARDAVAHLLRTPRERIAYLGDVLTIPTARQRYTGFTDALAAAGRPVRTDLVRHGLRTAEQARRAALELLGNTPPDAVFASQNLVTIGVLRALHERGLYGTIPLVGFDDLALAELLTPGLTVMAQDPAGIGRLAARLLFTRMAGDTSPPQRHTVPTRLLVRGSGELPGPRTVRPGSADQALDSPRGDGPRGGG
jgi:LacI family transcriptional regulator